MRKGSFSVSLGRYYSVTPGSDRAVQFGIAKWTINDRSHKVGMNPEEAIVIGKALIAAGKKLKAELKKKHRTRS